MPELVLLCCFFHVPTPAPDSPVLTPLLTWSVLQGADIVTTTIALNHGGREANPAMRWVVKEPERFLAVKAVVTLGVSWALTKASKRRPKLAKGVAWGLVVLQGAVVVHNIRQVSR